jgi:hypothetical protein
MLTHSLMYDHIRGESDARNPTFPAWSRCPYTASAAALNLAVVLIARCRPFWRCNCKQTPDGETILETPYESESSPNRAADVSLGRAHWPDPIFPQHSSSRF